jgi:hypothetical protein
MYGAWPRADEALPHTPIIVTVRPADLLNAQVQCIVGSEMHGGFKYTGLPPESNGSDSLIW